MTSIEWEHWHQNEHSSLALLMLFGLSNSLLDKTILRDWLNDCRVHANTVTLNVFVYKVMCLVVIFVLASSMPPQHLR